MASKYLIVGMAIVVICLSTLVFSGWRGGQIAQIAENIEVVYSMVGGYPGGSDIITIGNDGTIIEEYIPPIGEENKVTKVGKLTESELQGFKNLVIEANVFGFGDNYAVHFVTDLPRTSITFTIGGKIKTISIIIPENLTENLPENLTEIIQKIYEFKNELQ